MAPGGYPGQHATGVPISGLLQAETYGLVFHAGTRREKEQGQAVFTDGGRVLTVVGRAPGMDQARVLAYEGVAQIDLEGGFYRNDIAAGIENR